MGSISADAITAKASILLVDRTKKQWPESELLGWLNDGMLAILQYRPDAFTAVRTEQLVVGTRQAVPSADLRLLDVPRNMGISGVTPGRAVRYMDRSDLDLINPTWHNATPGATVRHWIYDQRVPRIWWCYPPQPTTSRGFVELFVSATPTPMTIASIDGASSTSLLPMEDTWLNVLLQWTVYRAFSKDNEYTQPGGKASLALNEFLVSLGVKTVTHVRFDPKKSKPPQFSTPRPGNVGAFGEG